MIISPNKIIGSLVYRTREALRNNQNFLDGLSIYDYNPNLFYEGEFSLWHYPGTQNEISNVFISLGENKDGSNLKYPSIFNINPIKQDKNGLNTTLHFNLCIVGPVLSEWLTQEREEQVFIPLLRPIYEEFINQIIKSGYFSLNFGAPAHKMYEVFTTGGFSWRIDRTVWRSYRCNRDSWYGFRFKKYL